MNRCDAAADAFENLEEMTQWLSRQPGKIPLARTKLIT